MTTDIVYAYCSEQSWLDQSKFKEIRHTVHFRTTLYESNKICLHFTEAHLVNALQLQERSGNLNQVLSISFCLIFLDLLSCVLRILRKRIQKLDAKRCHKVSVSLVCVFCQWHCLSSCFVLSCQ